MPSQKLRDLPKEDFSRLSKPRHNLLQHAALFVEWKQSIMPATIDTLGVMAQQADCSVDEIVRLSKDDFETLSLKILQTNHDEHEKLLQERQTRLEIPRPAAFVRVLHTKLSDSEHRNAVAVTPPAAAAAAATKSPATMPRTNYNPITVTPASNEKDYGIVVQPVTAQKLPVPPKGGPFDRICRALAELEAIGLSTPPRSQVAIMADYPCASTAGFKKAVCEAKKAGYVVYPDGNSLSLSAAGRQCVKVIKPVRSNADMLQRLRSIVEKKKAPKQASATLLQLLSDGSERTLVEVARVTGYPSHTTAGFKKFISIISSLDIIERPKRGHGGTIRLGNIAFPFGRGNGGAGNADRKKVAVSVAETNTVPNAVLFAESNTSPNAEGTSTAPIEIMEIVEI